MSDTVQIVTVVIAFLGTVFTGIMAYMTTKLNQKSNVVDEKLDTIHKLVNSSYTAQLKIGLTSLKRILALTAEKYSPSSTEVAEAASEVEAATKILDARLSEDAKVLAEKK